MKTIMVSDEAYKKLSSVKGSKSFTETISELVDRVKATKLADIESYFGIMSKEEAEDLKKSVAKIRKRFRARL